MKTYKRFVNDHKTTKYEITGWDEGGVDDIQDALDMEGVGEYDVDYEIVSRGQKQYIVPKNKRAEKVIKTYFK